MQPYGGFWIRFVAYIIDAVVLYIVSAILGAVLGIVGVKLGQIDGAEAPGGPIAVLQLLSGLITLLLYWLYFALMESSPRQATVGKMAMGLIVTDERGERIGFGRATGRYFGQIVSSIILGIGFIMIAWTERKQGLHDIMAGTLVYKSRSPDLVRSSAAIFE